MINELSVILLDFFQFIVDFLKAVLSIFIFIDLISIFFLVIFCLTFAFLSRISIIFHSWLIKNNYLNLTRLIHFFYIVLITYFTYGLWMLLPILIKLNSFYHGNIWLILIWLVLLFYIFFIVCFISIWRFGSIYNSYTYLFEKWVERYSYPPKQVVIWSIRTVWRSNEKRIKFLAFSCLLIFIVLLAIMTIVNIMNFNVAFLNPPPPENKKTIEFYYPYPYSNSFQLYVPNETETNSSLQFSIKIFLNYTGDLVAGTPVGVKASGILYPAGQKIVAPHITTSFSSNYSIDHDTEYHQAIIVGFEGATPYNPANLHNIGAGSDFAIHLENSSTSLLKYGEEPVNNEDNLHIVTWDTEGEYSPYVLIFPNNSYTSLPIPFDDYKLRVESRKSLKEDTYSRINTLVAFLLCVLTIIMTIPILFKWYSDLFDYTDDKRQQYKRTIRHNRKPPKK
jgi:hypothetical protein